MEAFIVDAVFFGAAPLNSKFFFLGGDSIHVPCYADENDPFFAGEVEQRLSCFFELDAFSADIVVQTSLMLEVPI